MTTEAAKVSVRLVVQRFRRCSLLVNNQTVTVPLGHQSDGDDNVTDLVSPSASGGCIGLLAYVSFASSATAEKVRSAAKTLVNLPVLTKGVWGDGQAPQSTLDLLVSSHKEHLENTDEHPKKICLVLVPQANLISKVKNGGKSIQYHGQISKDQGQDLYELFCSVIKALCLEQQLLCNQVDVPKFVSDILSPPPVSPAAVDPSVPPQDMYKADPRFSEWDEETGLPTKDANGDFLAKSAIKKLTKLQQSHRKKHEKFLKLVEEGKVEKIGDGDNEAKVSSPIDWSVLTAVQVVCGTFGARQGLELTSDMGPFCHIVNI